MCFTAIAYGADIEYSVVERAAEGGKPAAHFLIANDLVAAVAAKLGCALTVRHKLRGSQLAGTIVCGC